MEAEIPRLPGDIRRVERINGYKLPVGTMALGELEDLEDYCRWRAEDATHDWSVVRDTIDRRFPEGGTV